MSRAKSNVKAPAPAASNKPSSWKDRILPEDLADLEETFRVFDEDGSGTIDPEQISKVLDELGVDKRNPFILSLIYALRDTHRPISFNEFVDIVCNKVGECKTKDGCKRVFAIYDVNEDGVLDFEEFKAIAKQLKENVNDEDLLEMLHSTHVSQRTSSNECVSFEEFYRIVSKFNK